MEPKLDGTLRVWRGMYENHQAGPWVAEVQLGGMRHSERGHSEDEARSKLERALERLR